MHDKRNCQICIVDDDVSIRKGLRRLLRSHGFTPKEFSSAREFLDTEISQKTIGCILLDITMPGMSGLDMQDELLNRGIQLPIIFISGYGTVPKTVQAMKKGAIDFLEKPFDGDGLMQAIDHAVAVSRQREEESMAYRALKEKMAALTPRESQVFEHVVTGMLNREIAEQLGIVEKTVKVHRSRLMDKLGAKSVTDLVRMSEMLKSFSDLP